MIKTILIASILIALASCDSKLEFEISKSANSCFWNKCQEETKAFSTYYDAKTDKTNLSYLYKSCAIKIYSKAIELCEANYSYATYSADTIFTNFYKCIRSSCYSQSKNTCRSFVEGCGAVDEEPTLTSWYNDAAQKATFNAAYDACSYSSDASCPASLGTIAVDSCKLSGHNKCTNEWIEANKISSDDPCYPCDIFSSASRIIFSLLLSFLFIMF